MCCCTVPWIGLFRPTLRYSVSSQPLVFCVDPSSAIGPSGIHTKTSCIFDLSPVFATSIDFLISVGYRIRYDLDVTASKLNCSRFPSTLCNPWHWNHCGLADILLSVVTNACFSRGVFKWGHYYGTQLPLLKLCFRKGEISLVEFVLQLSSERIKILNNFSKYF